MHKKKSLGQHFLTSKHYLELIADSADIRAGEAVLEVGPGEGALTRELLARGAVVVAVEKDRRLIPVLQKTFAQEIAGGTFLLREGDALEMDFSRLFPEGRYKTAANIPYYITGAFMRKLFSQERLPSLCVLLIQKEVAERIARDKKESLPSLSVKAYGNPKYIKSVPAGAFSPPPKVDSAILCITGISRSNFRDAGHEERFFQLLHAGFAQKRKLLRRNIEKVFGEKAGEKMLAAGIPENARAEDVGLEQWLKLAGN